MLTMLKAFKLLCVPIFWHWTYLTEIILEWSRVSIQDKYCEYKHNVDILSLCFESYISRDDNNFFYYYIFTREVFLGIILWCIVTLPLSYFIYVPKVRNILLLCILRSLWINLTCIVTRVWSLVPSLYLLFFCDVCHVDNNFLWLFSQYLILPHVAPTLSKQTCVVHQN